MAVGRIVNVNNRMQTDYSYKLVKPEGAIDDLIGFKPDLSPIEMIRYGIMGGKYFSDVALDFEYPSEIRKLIFEKSVGISSERRKSYNYFNIHASSSLKEWRDKGWIIGDDPRGWIEWYLRTWMGRRDPEIDKQQIRRWKQMRRHLAQLKSACEPGDLECQPRRRQALLHWGFDTVNKY